MEFLEQLQNLCLDNTHCQDEYCTKKHPRCLEGVCIGNLQKLCDNQTNCNMLHHSKDQLEELLIQPINGYYLFNLCQDQCQNLNCRFSHPKWLPQICIHCLKKQNCDKTNEKFWHLPWVRVQKEVYKLYNREGINPENFCENYENCQCIAAKSNFNVNCIRYYKGVCPQIRCLQPHITWENSSQQIQQNQQIIVNSCIQFDAEKQQFIHRKQNINKSQIYVKRSQLSELVQKIHIRPQIDILFILDCTFSMQNWLDAARDNINGIIQQFKQKVPIESSVRIAVVCYKDYGEQDHINYCDFTTNAEKIQEFLNQQKAGGGADIPDDLVGALKQAYKLNISKEPLNILQMFIITDAPCHGRKYHKLIMDEKMDGDGLEKILSKFQQKKQRFYLAFIQLSDQTKQMEECIKKCVHNYSPASLKPKQFGDYVRFTLQSSLTKAYDIKELQEIYDYISGQFSKVNQIIEPYDNRNQQQSYLDYIENQIMQHKIVGLTQLQFEKNELEVKENGFESIVFKGFDQKNNQNIILKIPRFIINQLRQGHQIDQKDIQKAEMLAKFRFRNQIIAQQLAAQFNKISYEKKTDFFVPLYFPSPILYTLEKPIHGLKFIYGEILIEDENISWTKYSNNFDYFLKDNDLTTFSHFTYEATNHQVLVNDLQGYLNILTDPAIQTQLFNDQQQQEFQDFQPITDYNKEGIDAFFISQHQNCSDLCGIIGLNQKGNQRTIYADKLRDNKNLLYMCKNCSSLQQCLSNQNHQTLCEECKIKEQEETEISCKCCKVKFYQKQKFDQLRSSIQPFCKECSSQQCQNYQKKCIYCQKQICKRKVQEITTKQQKYCICLDAENYLRLLQCRRCSEKYTFDHFLSKEDYSQGNYICHKHQ